MSFTDQGQGRGTASGRRGLCSHRRQGRQRCVTRLDRASRFPVLMLVLLQTTGQIPARSRHSSATPTKALPTAEESGVS